MANCTRHPAIETYLSCTTCDRPFCYECLIPAAVGSKCSECAKGRPIGSTNTAKGRATVVAGELSANRLIALWAVLGVVAAANIAMLVRSSSTANIQSFSPLKYSLSLDGVKSNWWRLFSGAVAYQSIVSMAIGLGLTWWIGRFLCPRLRPLRFVALCASSIAAGALLTLLISPSGGAFGGLSLSAGMFGAQLAGQRRGTLSRLQIPRMQSFGYAGLFLGWFLFSSLLGGLGSIGALLGGALAGGILGYLMLERTGALPGQKSPGEARQAIIGVALAVACFLLAFGLAQSKGSSNPSPIERKNQPTTSALFDQ